MGAVAESKVWENVPPHWPRRGPGDRKVRPSVCPTPQGPKGWKTKGQGGPLWLY